MRLRLTAAFAAAMAVILAAIGVFLYLRLGDSLDEAIDESLLARADNVAALVRQSRSALREGGSTALTEPDESFTQVLTTDGAVVDFTRRTGSDPLIRPADVERAREAPVFLERSAGGDDEPARLLVAAIDAGGRKLVVVVGAATDGRSEALQALLAQLIVGGPIALLLASFLAYGLAAAALRPVEAMRRRAAAITAAAPDDRLPVPDTSDEVARLGHTLNDMLGRLAAALERERTFVSDASHELRTPLAALKAELDLALRRPRSRDELEAALRSAAVETDRLAQLAEDLLVLARADSGRLPLRLEPVQVRTLLERIAGRFAGRAAIAERVVTVDAPARLTLHGDRLRLEQALANLVDNALRHGRGAVSLIGRARGSFVALHVLDEGPGIPPGLIDSAFDRFTRGDTARSDSGTGLGLAIADMIARNHGGRAGIENHEGRGLDVWLEIPAETAHDGRSAPAAATR